jgi:hypothetical protein
VRWYGTEGRRGEAILLTRRLMPFGTLQPTLSPDPCQPPPGQGDGTRLMIDGRPKGHVGLTVKRPHGARRP